MRVLETGTVEGDVVETTEGLRTKKHRKVSQKYYNILLRTAENYYVQSTTPYHEVSTTTH